MWPLDTCAGSLLELGKEVYQNRTYRSFIIRDPDRGDPAVQQLQWLYRSLTPFGIRGIEQQVKEGGRSLSALSRRRSRLSRRSAWTGFRRGKDIKARRALQRELR